MNANRRFLALCLLATVLLWAFGGAAGAAVTLPNGDPDPSNANLRLWLKADAGVTGTTNVTGWADQSVNGFNFSTSTGPERIGSVAGLNNEPALRFNGSTEYLDGPASIYNQTTSTTFLVAQSKSPGAGSFRFIFDTGSQRHTSYFDNRGGGNQGWGINMNGPGNFPNPGAVYDDGYDVFTAVVNGSSTVTSVNGGSDLTGTQNGGTSGSPFRIGARNSSPSASNFFNADLAEMIIYNRALTGAEENAVGFYLEQKYGLDTAYFSGTLITLGATPTDLPDGDIDLEDAEAGGTFTWVNPGDGGFDIKLTALQGLHSNGGPGYAIIDNHANNVVTYEFFETGTTTPVDVTGLTLTLGDIDGDGSAPTRLSKFSVQTASGASQELDTSDTNLFTLGGNLAAVDTDATGTPDGITSTLSLGGNIFADSRINAVLDLGPTVFSKLSFEANNEYITMGNSDVSIITIIPEPSTFALLALGLLGLMAFGWRRRT